MNVPVCIWCLAVETLHSLEQRHFITSLGEHITHHKLVAALLDAVLLPAQLFVYATHTLTTLAVFLGKMQEQKARQPHNGKW